MAHAADEIVFYTHPHSRGQTVRWILEEIGAPYRAEILDYQTSMKAPAYLAINPMGKVPAVAHRGVVVTEGAAICAYLADAFPEAGLAPAASDPARGLYYRWLFFAAGPLESASSNAAMGFVTPAEREMSMGYGSLARVLDALEGVLSGRTHVAGERFTAADLYLASYLGVLMRFQMIEPRPAFEAYVALHAARPAAERARKRDEALIAQTGG